MTVLTLTVKLLFIGRSNISYGEGYIKSSYKVNLNDQSSYPQVNSIFYNNGKIPELLYACLTLSLLFQDFLRIYIRIHLVFSGLRGHVHSSN